MSRRAVQRRIVVLAVAVAVGVAAAVVLSAQLRPGAPDRQASAERADDGAIPADRVGARLVTLPTFAPGAGADGGNTSLEDVTAVGRTAVAVGTIESGPHRRPLFLASTDQGRTWSTARLDGPPELLSRGSAPYAVAAGPGGAVALGSEVAGTALWTSADGTRWERRATSAEQFRRTDDVDRLTAGPQGYVAVGSTVGSGGVRAPALWTSPDGRSWTRRTESALGLPVLPEGTRRSFDDVALRGQAVVVVGSVRHDGEGDEQGRTKEAAIVISLDGGASFRDIDGLSGLAGDANNFLSAVTASPAGFTAVGSGGSNASWDPVVLRSRDGRSWSRDADAGLQTDAEDYPADITASTDGPVVVGIKGGDGAVLARSGQRWADVAAPPELLGQGNQSLSAAVALEDVVIAVGQDSRRGERDAMIVRRQAGVVSAVPLPALARLSTPGATISALRLAPDGSVLAAGSSTGDGAVWRSEDGSAFGLVPGLRVPGTTQETLLDIGVGEQSADVVVVGRRTRTNAPAAVAQRSTAGGPLKDVVPAERLDIDPASGQFEGRVLTSVARRDGRTVLVGNRVGADDGAVVLTVDDATGAVAEGKPETPRDEQYAPEAGEDLSGGRDLTRSMARVAYAPDGSLLAVGCATSVVAQPCGPGVWTSRDGRVWALGHVYRPDGLVSSSMGDVVRTGAGWTAVGTGARSDGRQAPLAWNSTDGVVWNRVVEMPGGSGGEAFVSGVASTDRGLVAVGGALRDGDFDAAVWLSADGAAWRLLPLPKITGGAGTQLLDEVVLQGGRVLATGSSSAAGPADALVVTVPLATLPALPRVPSVTAPSAHAPG